MEAGPNLNDALLALQKLDDIYKQAREALENFSQPLTEFEQQATAAFSRTPEVPAVFFKSVKQTQEEVSRLLEQYCSVAEHVRRLLDS